jgi:iron(III) transport system permease protein
MSFGWLWPTALLVILTFLVIYPVSMLLLGALTNTNPVVDGFGVFDLSLTNFITVLGNPNVHLALANSMIACGGGTALAVVIGLMFSWVVVRTDTPCKRFIAAASMIPLFVPPLVAAVAWSILASPKTGLLNTLMAWAGITWRLDVYTMTGLIVIFGIYYAPYVYMFTASALRNMDPALEEAAEVAGAGALRILLTVTFPLIAPAIISGMLLSFVVMLGIYGIPAVLGAPGDIPVLTTYIFKLTNWSPPLYSTAASVAIILMVVTGFLVWLQQKVVSGRSYITVAGKAFRPGVMKLGAWRYFTLGLAVVYLVVVVVLPTLALIVAAFRKFLFIRNMESLFDTRQYSLIHFERLFDNPLAMRSIVNTMEVGFITALIGGVFAFAIGYTVNRTTVRGRGAINVISTIPVAIPGLVIGVAYLWAWIGLPGGLYGTIWILGARLHRALHARHDQGPVHFAVANPSRVGRSLMDLRQGTARHDPHDRAAARASRRHRCDDAAVHSGDPRARLIAVPLHQQHHGDGGAPARLLRGRQCRHHLGVQLVQTVLLAVLIGIAHYLSRGGADTSGVGRAG